MAAAYTIRSLHVGKDAASDAKRKTKALILAFSFAITLRVVSEYAPGVLWDWHLFYTLSRIGWTSAIRAESWVRVLCRPLVLADGDVSRAGFGSGRRHSLGRAC